MSGIIVLSKPGKVYGKLYSDVIVNDLFVSKFVTHRKNFIESTRVNKDLDNYI